MKTQSSRKQMMFDLCSLGEPRRACERTKQLEFYTRNDSPAMLIDWPVSKRADRYESRCRYFKEKDSLSKQDDRWKRAGFRSEEKIQKSIGGCDGRD